MCSFHKSITFRILTCAIVSSLFISLTMDTYAKKPADTQPPTAPSGLTCTTVTQNSAGLKWTSSVDNKGVASYLIYRNSANIASVTSTSYTVTGLSAGTAYSFYIRAKDYSGNISSPSNVLNVTTPASTASAGKIITGYYANWAAYSGYTPLNIPAAKLTNINYAFAKIGTDLKIAMTDPTVDPSNISKLNQLKSTYPSLKTLISIGGWDDSGNFSYAALTDASRTIFADSVVAFIKQYGFNGVDIDWEYPVSGGLSTNVRRPEDKTNFTLMLAKLREKLNAQGQADGKKYLLTIAGEAGSGYAANTELNLIAGYVDYANLMTYDIHGNWDRYTDLNAPLYNPLETSPQYKWSVESAVNLWVSKGFPINKMVLGVPFYGYIYNGVSNINNGLFQTFLSGGSITYDKVAANYLSNASYVKRIHPDAKVPWLFNGSTFISYDDEQSLAAKAGYIKQKGLAGASIWELSQNKNGILLNAVTSNLS